MPNDYDILITGAGPAGTACALVLKDAGLRVALLDRGAGKHGKTCGDAVPGPCLAMLERLIPGALSATGFPARKQPVTASDLYAPSGRHIRVTWKAEAYNIPRENFDRYLRELVRERTATEYLESTRAVKFTAIPGGIRCRCHDGRTLTATVVAGCDGAHSITAKDLCKTGPDPYRHTIAGRVYLQMADRAESVNRFFLPRSVRSGYAWLFPVGQGRYNAGIGVINGPGQKTPLKTLFADLLQNDPVMGRFTGNAEILTPFTGHPLPIWHPDRRYTGERCLLCGDAAGLVDPLQGHGMHTAMQSGILAGTHLSRSFGNGGFNDTVAQRYVSELKRTVLPELRRNYVIMLAMRAFPRLPELIINSGGLIPWGKIASRLL